MSFELYSGFWAGLKKQLIYVYFGVGVRVAMGLGWVVIFTWYGLLPLWLCALGGMMFGEFAPGDRVLFPFG